jgi:AcrR family transcriptional regulator
MAATTEGLRERKKRQTREAIAQAAMALFVEHGFDAVTVADVARAADVSEKTVFNYFPTKEDLFYDEVDEREAALVEAVRNRRPGETIPAALERLQAAGCTRLCSEGFARFARIIEESPALQAKELELMARFTDALAGAIQSELGVHELDARIAANALVGVQWQQFRTARTRALAGRHGPGAARRLRSDLKRAHRLLEDGLGQLEASGSTPQPR